MTHWATAIAHFQPSDRPQQIRDNCEARTGLPTVIEGPRRSGRMIRSFACAPAHRAHADAIEKQASPRTDPASTLIPVAVRPATGAGIRGAPGDHDSKRTGIMELAAAMGEAVAHGVGQGSLRSARQNQDRHDDNGQYFCSVHGAFAFGLAQISQTDLLLSAGPSMIGHTG